MFDDCMNIGAAHCSLTDDPSAASGQCVCDDMYKEIAGHCYPQGNIFQNI